VSKKSYVFLLDLYTDYSAKIQPFYGKKMRGTGKVDAGGGGGRETASISVGFEK